MAEKGDWIVKVLERKISDHRAIFLWTDDEKWGPKPFKVFDIWLDNSVLLDMVKEVWEKEESNITNKLRIVRNNIRKWNKDINRDINARIELMEKEQFQLEEEGHGEEEINCLNLNLFKLYEERASMLRQKSRIQWEIKGDENSKFFHSVMN